ncbi:MAG: DNA translocase FtsK [Bacillota bacterium]
MAEESRQEILEKRKNEIIGILMISFGIYSALALFSSGAGMIGENLANFYFLIVGLGSYIIPVLFIIWGLLLVRSRNIKFNMRLVGFLISFLVILSLIHTYNYPEGDIAPVITYYQPGGGFLGGSISLVCLRLFGNLGSYIVLITSLVIGVLLWMDILLQPILQKTGKLLFSVVTGVINKTKLFWQKVLSIFARGGTFVKGILRRNNRSAKSESEERISGRKKDLKKEIEEYISEEAKKAEEKEEAAAEEIRDTENYIKTEDRMNKENRVDNGDEVNKEDYYLDNNGQESDDNQEESGGDNQQTEQKDEEDYPEYRLPPLKLLESSGKTKVKLKNNSDLLEKTLDSFGVQARVTGVSHGPSITRYEVQPESGVKVSKIVNLADDIALALAAPDVRIEAPIPGKGAIGIEVPHQGDMFVRLRDILASEEFEQTENRLTLALGKGIEGKPMVADLSSMPHLLVAGATGSGKSVCLNSFITSLLYKATPTEVKLILVDPKKVELSNYKGLPHLFTPVVTDPKKAANVLKLIVEEMEDRYDKFSDTGTRGINSYNKKVDSEEQLPYLVVIIDELSDLMMVAASEVEDNICRLAQMSRAAGIHLIIATQRPSVDVITGLIKANIPSRISFAVSSQTDSRTILDMGGAEKLLGNGDMLYAPVNRQKPIRIQGSFISDEESNRVVDFVKRQTDPEFEVELDDIKEISVSTRNEKDELYDEAVKLVVSYRASISMLQRKLHIGHSRAARMIDMMEEEGIVGPHAGSKPREVLISEDELPEYLEEVERVEQDDNGSEEQKKEESNSDSDHVDSDQNNQEDQGNEKEKKSSKNSSQEEKIKKEDSDISDIKEAKEDEAGIDYNSYDELISEKNSD